ncbi:MAG TPA: hypothetical protein VN419_12370 [Humidesulfovibrio sp.]|nr:hypothetical protein [Humidesulfovibrio sp.]HWR04797.1 hypothetical protein [Humidesulfovibrio sp.]
MMQTNATYKSSADAVNSVAFSRAAILRTALILRKSQRDPS